LQSSTGGRPCTLRDHVTGGLSEDRNVVRRGTITARSLHFVRWHSAIAEMRNIGLSHSVGEKLARFLLDLSKSHDNGKGEVKVTLTLTHEEIAQTIGTSRETVTRLFGEFKRKQLMQVKGSTLIIKNKAGLESVLNS
jgi:CRP/FNR family transcriptional regulator